jgi:hypothetical protein
MGPGKASKLSWLLLPIPLLIHSTIFCTIICVIKVLIKGIIFFVNYFAKKSRKNVICIEQITGHIIFQGGT